MNYITKELWKYRLCGEIFTIKNGLPDKIFWVPKPIPFLFRLWLKFRVWKSRRKLDRWVESQFKFKLNTVVSTNDGHVGIIKRRLLCGSEPYYDIYGENDWAWRYPERSVGSQIASTK